MLITRRLFLFCSLFSLQVFGHYLRTGWRADRIQTIRDRNTSLDAKKLIAEFKQGAGWVGFQALRPFEIDEFRHYGSSGRRKKGNECKENKSKGKKRKLEDEDEDARPTDDDNASPRKATKKSSDVAAAKSATTSNLTKAIAAKRRTSQTAAKGHHSQTNIDWHKEVYDVWSRTSCLRRYRRQESIQALLILTPARNSDQRTKKSGLFN